MATYNAVAAISETLRTLLESACPRGEFPDARFELFQASDFQQKMDEGISVFLYRIAVNTTHRNLTPTVRLDGRRVRPPIPVDLYYLFNAWGKAVSRQHALLGWCVRTLEDATVLPASVLNSPFGDAFRPSEGIELVCDPLSLADLNTLWEVLRPNIPVSVGYVVRAVPLESMLPLAEYAPVQTRELEFQR